MIIEISQNAINQIPAYLTLCVSMLFIVLGIYGFSLKEYTITITFLIGAIFFLMLSLTFFGVLEWKITDINMNYTRYN